MSPISSTAEYALRAIVHLATRQGQPMPAQQIAAAVRVSPGYLSKVMHDLVDAGIVRSQRGPNGGFALASDPASTTLLDIVNAVDPITRIKACPLGLPEHGKNLCRLHQRLDEAIASIQLAFSSCSIADLLEPAAGSPSCQFPTLDG